MADDITCEEIENPRVWQRFCPPGPVPLQQSAAYGEAMAALGPTCRRVLLRHAGAPVALAQIFERRLYGLVTLATLFRGPVWLQDDLALPVQEACYRTLMAGYRKWRWQFLAVMPEQVDGPEATAMLRGLGARRVMTGYTTAWVPLAAEEATLRAGLGKKWRNTLKKAEAGGIRIRVQGDKPRHWEWLLEKEKEQRQRLGYQALPVDIVAALARAAGDPPIVCVTASQGAEPIAGALFIRHGDAATYHIGWNGDIGRLLGAQNLVMWRGLLALREAGVRWLDLGGLNTASGAGIARFKLGLGAPPLVLTGTWV